MFRALLAHQDAVPPLTPHTVRSLVSLASQMCLKASSIALGKLLVKTRFSWPFLWLLLVKHFLNLFLPILLDRSAKALEAPSSYPLFYCYQNTIPCKGYKMVIVEGAEHRPWGSLGPSGIT